MEEDKAKLKHGTIIVLRYYAGYSPPPKLPIGSLRIIYIKGS
jgi:hypothetical protein